MKRLLLGLVILLILGALVAPALALAAAPSIIGPADFNAAINILSIAQASHQYFIDHPEAIVRPDLQGDVQWHKAWVEIYAKVIILLKLQRGD